MIVEINEDKYEQAYLCFDDGCILYAKDNYLGKPKNSVKVDESVYQVRELLRMGIIQEVVPEKVKENKKVEVEGKNEKIKEEPIVKEESIIIDNKTPETIKEIKTTTNDKEINKLKEVKQENGESKR
jgi:hypothetical protein